MMQKMRDIKCTNHLLITGISLGGALSSISFIDIDHYMKDVFKKIEVVTFGSPRVGNKHWAANYDAKLAAYPSSVDLLPTNVELRYRVKNDPIPDLPRCLVSWVLGICAYEYVGVAAKCYFDGSYDGQCVLNDNYEFNPIGVYNFLTKEVDENIKGEDEGNLCFNPIDGIGKHICYYPKIGSHSLVAPK